MNTMTHNRNRGATTTPGETAVYPAEPNARRFEAGLAILRVIVGTVFMAHGAQKMFVFGFGGLTEVFAGMGIPLPVVAAPAVALLEFFGGLALIVGLFTPLVAAGLAVVMVGAIMFVHLPAGFFAPDGIEFTLTLFAAAVTLALTGAGAWSLDGLRRRRRTQAAHA